MNTSFTPGPWVAAKTQSEYGSWGVFTKDGGYSVLDGSAPHGQAEANARLIAASPDLLSALQEMYSLFYAHEQYDDDSAAAVKLARAAINLATGQEP